MFTPNQVVNEKLTRSLSSDGSIPERDKLSAGITTGVDMEAGIEVLKVHPIAVWLENKVALDLRDGELVRGKPRRMSEIVADLAVDSGIPEDRCRPFLQDLLQWISVVNVHLQQSGERYTLLPFKLHQFISQTGSVYTTLDQDENRYITLEPGMFKEDEADKKPIFSRTTGNWPVPNCLSVSGSRPASTR